MARPARDLDPPVEKMNGTAELGETLALSSCWWRRREAVARWSVVVVKGHDSDGAAGVGRSGGSTEAERSSMASVGVGREALLLSLSLWEVARGRRREGDGDRAMGV